MDNEKLHQPYSRDDKARRSKERTEAATHKKSLKAKTTARNDLYICGSRGGLGGEEFRQKDITKENLDLDIS